MQCVALPVKILNSIDRLSRNFLWGTSESKKRLHLVSWKKIAKPKKDGGLGIHAAKVKNVSNLAKLNWRLHAEPSSLWARVLSQKYCSLRRSSNARSFKSCSTTWSAIRKGESVFKKRAKWVVGKDNKLSLKFDKWLDRGPLRSLIAGPLNRGEEQVALNDVTGFLGWTWSGYSFSFPDRLISEIKAAPISFYARNVDRITWSSSPSGNFELIKAYKLESLEEEGHYTSCFDGDWIWKASTIPKIKCFVWQCLHKSIPVNTILAARGMEVSLVC
ncbi:hypothetical protein ACB092_07G006600 [Castanea dentata]